MGQIAAFLIDTIQNHISHALKYPTSIVRLDVGNGHTILPYNGFNFDQQFLNRQAMQSLFPVPIDPSLENAILGECQWIFLTAFLRTGIYFDLPTALQLANLSEAKILAKLNAIDLDYEISIRVLTEISDVVNVDGWIQCYPDREERAIMAHQSGMAATEFLSRLQFCTFFRRKLSKFMKPNDNESVLDEIERFVLAMSLATEIPVKLDNVEIECVEWNLYWEKPFYFLRRHGAWDSNHSDASSVQFFSRYSRGSPQYSEDNNTRTSKWLMLLNQVEGAVIPLKGIQRGLWSITVALNNQVYLAKSNALSGILDIFVSMDGLVRKTEGGRHDRHKFKFTKAWKKIVNESRKLPNQKSADKVIEKLYSLRCVLAHGGTDVLQQRLKDFKVALGDSHSTGSYHPIFVGMSLAAWTRNILDTFYSKQELLLELYQTSKKTEDTPYNEYAANRMLAGGALAAMLGVFMWRLVNLDIDICLFFFFATVLEPLPEYMIAATLDGFPAMTILARIRAGVIVVLTFALFAWFMNYLQALRGAYFWASVAGVFVSYVFGRFYSSDHE